MSFALPKMGCTFSKDRFRSCCRDSEMSGWPVLEFILYLLDARSAHESLLLSLSIEIETPKLWNGICARCYENCVDQSLQLGAGGDCNNEIVVVQNTGSISRLHVGTP